MTTQKYKYITLSQLLASVASDLTLYDSAGFLSKHYLNKVIHRCNDKLGIKIHKSKQCLINIHNGKGELPEDFWKIETIFATYLQEVPSTMQLIPGNIVEYTTDPSCTPGTIINSPRHSYVDSCGNCLWAIKYPTTKEITKITTIIPLTMSQSCLSQTTHYCPTKTGQFGIDLDDNIITTTFKEGQIFLCYLGNMEDENGEVLIPFHPLLNDYYEYSVKERMLENIFLNSEDDVEKKLQYVIAKRKDAYIDAWQFTGLPEYKELDNYDKKRIQTFYNKWYKIFQN